jgi:hypothetical protein
MKCVVTQFFAVSYLFLSCMSKYFPQYSVLNTFSLTTALFWVLMQRVVITLRSVIPIVCVKLYMWEGSQ